MLLIFIELAGQGRDPVQELQHQVPPGAAQCPGGFQPPGGRSGESGHCGQDRCWQVESLSGTFQVNTTILLYKVVWFFVNFKYIQTG